MRATAIIVILYTNQYYMLLLFTRVTHIFRYLVSAHAQIGLTHVSSRFCAPVSSLEQSMYRESLRLSLCQRTWEKVAYLYGVIL